MMQEVSDEIVVTQAGEAAIADQLQDAAQTNVTQGSLGQTVGTLSSPISSASSAQSVPPPSQLPANFSSPISAPSQLPTSFTSPLPMTPQQLSHQLANTGITASPGPGMHQASPPPPMGGFVRSPGAVTGTPSKYPSIPASSPGQYAMSTSAYTPTPVSSLPPSMSQSMPPPPTFPSIGSSPQAPQITSPYTTTPVSSQPPIQSIQMSPPVAMHIPHDDASASIDLGNDPIGPVYPNHQEETKQGLFGWFSGSNFMNKVVEKTKTLSENVITTLDPGMKEVIYTGNDGVQVMVASQKEVKVGAVRQAFYEVFGRAVVDGMDSQPVGIAPQPVGYQAALKGCEERLEQLRRSRQVDDRYVMIAVENFIVEILPDRWYDIGCILLKDSVNNIELKTFTTATPVPSEYVQQAQDETPSTYDLRWSGLAVTVGQMINRNLPYVNHADWHTHFTGVSRRDMIYMGVKVLAGMYKQRLPPSAASAH